MSFPDLRELLPSRTQHAARGRWRRYLQSGVQDSFNSKLHHSVRQESDWSPSEDQLLISLRSKGKERVEIAQSFPTRSSAACKGRRYSSMACNPKKPGKWTKLDKEILVSLVNEIGPDWDVITKHFPNRTAAGCCVCYYRYRDGRRKWTKVDKEILMSLVNEIGSDWDEIAKHFQHRTAAGCSSWYYQNRDKIDRGHNMSRKWTKVEKETLKSLVYAIGPRWFEIAKQFQNRTESGCFHFYYRYRDEIDGKNGPSRNEWQDIWDSE